MSREHAEERKYEYEFRKDIKKAKIVIHSPLKKRYYDTEFTGKRGLSVFKQIKTPLIADDLRELEYTLINRDGDVNVTIHGVTPIPTEFGVNQEELVIELVEHGKRYITIEDWEKFLENTVDKILEAIASPKHGAFVTVEYDGDKCFNMLEAPADKY